MLVYGYTTCIHIRLVYPFVKICEWICEKGPLVHLCAFGFLASFDVEVGHDVFRIMIAHSVHSAH